jgi:D-amino peptidase
MEGLAGIDQWDQCYHPDDNAPEYRYGLEQLTAEVNAAVAGCFDAGATTVRVLDGHGRNQNRGFLRERLDPRAEVVWIAQRDPLRWEGLGEEVAGVAMIGQHAMAGTINGFLDHTQNPKTLCRYLINGVEYGEMGQLALYAGGFGVPLFYVSGDEALCAEAGHQFPHVVSTPTKKGTGWATCELYPPDTVREQIRHDIAEGIVRLPQAKVWRQTTPLEVTIEWAWSEHADRIAKVRGVTRQNARTVSWRISDPRDIYNYPSAQWEPNVE